MEIDACSPELWQKGEAGGNHLGVIGECRGAETQVGLQSQAQKLRWVSQQPFGQSATSALASFLSAGHSFHVLARSMSTPCLSCKVSEIQRHWSISTCYLQNHRV